MMQSSRSHPHRKSWWWHHFLCGIISHPHDFVSFPMSSTWFRMWWFPMWMTSYVHDFVCAYGKTWIISCTRGWFLSDFARASFPMWMTSYVNHFLCGSFPMWIMSFWFYTCIISYVASFFIHMISYHFLRHPHDFVCDGFVCGWLSTWIISYVDDFLCGWFRMWMTSYVDDFLCGSLYTWIISFWF